MTYIPFFLFKKQNEFYKGFPKNIGFLTFGGQKIKIWKFRDNHFVERVIL